MSPKESEKTYKTNKTSSQTGVELKALRQAFLDRAQSLVEPVLADCGFELVLASCPMENGFVVLRFYIERHQEEGESRDGLSSEVTLDDCTLAARAIGEVLESEQSSFSGSYLLEVSSPGLNRPLVKEVDYQRFQGRLVKLKLRTDGGGTSVYKGRLACDPCSGGLALETSAGLVPFILSRVSSCRLSLDNL